MGATAGFLKFSRAHGIPCIQYCISNPTNNERLDRFARSKYSAYDIETFPQNIPRQTSWASSDVTTHGCPVQHPASALFWEKACCTRRTRLVSPLHPAIRPFGDVADGQRRCDATISGPLQQRCISLVKRPISAGDKAPVTASGGAHPSLIRRCSPARSCEL